MVDPKYISLQNTQSRVPACGLSTLSWRLPRNIDNLKFVVIPSDGSGNIKSCPYFGTVTPIGQHQVKFNVLTFATNGHWNLSNSCIVKGVVDKTHFFFFLWNDLLNVSENIIL